MHLPLLLAAAALTLLAGCHDGSDNNRITVKNRTDAAITVRYRTEVDQRRVHDGDGDGSNDVAVVEEQRWTRVPAHDECDIRVQDVCWWSWVEVHTPEGWSRSYRVRVDGVGRGTLWARPEHFPAEPTAPVGSG